MHDFEMNDIEKFPLHINGENEKFPFFHPHLYFLLPLTLSHSLTLLLKKLNANGELPDGHGIRMFSKDNPIVMFIMLIFIFIAFSSFFFIFIFIPFYTSHLHSSDNRVENWPAVICGEMKCMNVMDRG